MDKEIVLDQFIADRLEAMLEQATGEKAKVLENLRDSVVDRTKDLEEKQKELPKAPFNPNWWDSEADKLHHVLPLGIRLTSEAPMSSLATSSTGRSKNSMGSILDMPKM